MRSRKRRLLTLVIVLALPPAGQAQGLKPRATLEAHGEGARCVVFSPDGKYLASGGTGRDGEGVRTRRWGEVRLWEVATGKERWTAKGHPRDVEALAFRADGKALAAGDSDGFVKVWDVADGKQIANFKLNEAARCVAFSPDGKLLGACGTNETAVWETATGKNRIAFRRPDSGWNAALSPDLTAVASPNFQDADLWDLATGEHRGALLDHRGSVYRVAFRPDGKVLAVGSNRDRADGKRDSEIRLWDLATKKERGRHRDVVNFLWVLEFSPDGELLAVVGSEDLREPEGIKLLDVSTGRVVAGVPPLEGYVRLSGLAFSPDGKQLAAACSDGKVRLWEVVPAKDDRPGR